MAGALDLTNPNPLTLTGGTVNYTNPQWYDQYMQGVAGQGNTLTGSGPGSIANTMANWNIDPSTGQPAQLTGDWNQNLANAGTAAQGAAQPGGYLAQAGNANAAASTYNPAQFQQFLNPYTQDAANATTNLSNKNLFENVLPGVNSTFVGNGQFGSARNADFENRAIRDQQQTLTNSLGQLNYGAAKDAQTQNLQEQQIGQTGAMNAANLGNQNITNLNTTGQNFLNWQNQGMQANYQDYLKQLQYPIDAMGALTQMTGALKGSVQPSQTLTPGAMTQQQKLAALGSMIGSLGSTNTGSGTSTLDAIKALWDQLNNTPQ